MLWSKIMPGLNFAQALERLKRKSYLRGRPVTQQEVAGVAEGEGQAASDKLFRIRQVELERQRLEQQQAQHAAELKQREKDREAAQKSSERGSAASGATAGALVGYEVASTAIGGVYGAIIGGVIGYGASQCIIITACTSSDSPEVNIARKFRDKYMSNYHLGGYYALAEGFTPLIKKFHFIKLIVKRFLVDRLVDYGEWILGYKPKMRFRTSRMVTDRFLSLCASIGKRVNIKPLIEAHRS